MRVYAVLLGVILTAGSAYLAQVAIASAGFERLANPSPGRGSLSAGGELWYGGVLDPITIEAGRAPTTAIASGPGAPRSEPVVRQKAEACARPARSKRAATASARVPASVGSTM